MHLHDLLFGYAARGPRFFADGWGDRALCEGMDPVALARRRPAEIDVTLGPPRPAHGGFLSDGVFESPETRLPACAAPARFQLLLPEGPRRGVAVHLAASGDQGFALRLRFAAPLLARGIGALVLENPYYGKRRPERQRHVAIRSVSDLSLMGSATFQEGRALLRWLVEHLRIPHVGVTGFSMGGQFAAMIGASMPFPVAAVPVAPCCSPDTVLRQGVLRHVADVAAIASPGEDAAAAREALCRHLARYSVCVLPPPRFPEGSIVVGTRGDGVVPPADMARIAEHWGSELRWLEAGHVTAVLRHQGAMRQALADAFDRLEAAMPAGVAAAHRERRAARVGRAIRSRARRVRAVRGSAGIARRASSRARPPRA